MGLDTYYILFVHTQSNLNAFAISSEYMILTCLFMFLSYLSLSILGLAMRLYLLMRIDAHQMRSNAHGPHQ